MTLGSLFDGIGGFPLAASRYGITPVWASEIEPFCVAVTRRRFPEMIHLGDITKIDGGKIPPVDIITFGSPCQDLSVAGNRAGLSGERSGLFHEAVRIIYEMRKATNGKAPTYIVWENVPGAFSSNHGRDFQAVLAEVTKANIPMPRSGRWANAGVVRGIRITFAWRVLDAQYWGVPQRRKRIYAVGSFGSRRAEEILFKPDGMQGNTPSSRASGEGATDTATRSAGGCHCYDARGIGGGEVTPTIIGDHASRVNDYMPLIVTSAGFSHKNSASARGIGFANEISPTLRATQENAVVYSIGNGQANQTDLSDKAGALNCMHDQQAVFIIGSYNSKGMSSNNPHSGFYQTNTSRTLDHNGGNPCCNQGGMVIVNHNDFIVRRFTPLEGERLMDFPDGWTDIGPWTDDSGKLHRESSDAARYRVIGNSLALPCAERVISGIAVN